MNRKKKLARKSAPSQIVCLRLPALVLKKLDAMARREKVTRTALIARALLAANYAGVGK